MILIFKTSVTTKKAAKSISPLLHKLLSNAIWNFDLNDCDNILRIDTKENVANEIITAMRGSGFTCEELD